MNTIAVVIPAYNVEKTILRALGSVVTQTRKPNKIVVVDDGSTDGTAALVQKFNCDVHIQLIRQANAGAAAARQTGSDAAGTDYIAYLDADDWWPWSFRLEQVERYIDHYPINFLFSDLERQSADHGFIPHSRNINFFPWAKEHLEKGRKLCYEKLLGFHPDNATDLLLKGFPAFPSTYVVRTAALFCVGGWDRRFKRCQDFDLALRLARNYGFHYYNGVTAVMGLDSHNTDTNAYVLKQTRGDIEVLRHHYKMADGEYKQKIAVAISEKLCGLGHLLKQMGDKRESKKAYFNAVAWPGKRVHALIRGIAVGV